MKKVSILVAFSAFLLTACGGGPGTQAELEEVLVLSEEIDSEEASCISSAIFAEYGSNEAAMNSLTGQTIEEIRESIAEAEAAAAEVAGPLAPGEEPAVTHPLAGFEEFYDALLQDCLN